MIFKESPQHSGAGRARVWHHHGSDTPTSPRAIRRTILHTTVDKEKKHVGFPKSPMFLFQYVLKEYVIRKKIFQAVR